MKELVVTLAGARAGRLVQKDNGNLQFRYDEAYSGPPISYAMPVQAEAHPHRLCQAVFGGLLLEGDGRATLAKALGVSANNDFGLLEEVGRDVAGAVALLETDETVPTTPEVRRQALGVPSAFKYQAEALASQVGVRPDFASPPTTAPRRPRRSPSASSHAPLMSASDQCSPTAGRVPGATTHTERVGPAK